MNITNICIFLMLNYSIKVTLELKKKHLIIRRIEFYLEKISFEYFFEQNKANHTKVCLIYLFILRDNILLS